MLSVLQVGPICDSVRQDGDAAVRQLTEKFDKVKLDDICVPVQVRTQHSHAAATCAYSYAVHRASRCSSAVGMRHGVRFLVLAFNLPRLDCVCT